MPQIEEYDLYIQFYFDDFMSNAGSPRTFTTNINDLTMEQISGITMQDMYIFPE